MLVCQNAEEVHGQRKVGNSCFITTVASFIFVTVWSVSLTVKLPHKPFTTEK